MYVLAWRGDISALVCADAGQIGQWPYEAIHVGFPERGFDGQFYYILARDPWRHYDAPLIDLPVYRHARILYPGLAWALTGGDPVGLLWVFPAINLLALGGLAWMGARLAVHFERNEWWGALLPIVLNTGMSALRNLTDPLATVMLCGLLTAWLVRWPAWLLAAWAVMAALSREQNVLIIGIVLLEALRTGRRTCAVGLLAALALWLAWVFCLHAAYGAWPLAPGNVSPPFAGMWYRWTHLEGRSGSISRVIHVAGMLLLTCQVGLSFTLIWFQARRMWIIIALLGAALAIVGGTGIYENGWSYARVFLWMPLGIWLWTMESGRRWPALLLTSTAFWQVAAVVQAWGH
jgi:hypothetical protein